MKFTIFLVLISLAQTFYAQDLKGSWTGDIEISGKKLPLILNIDKTNNEFFSTVISPQQGNAEIKVDKTEFSNSELILEMISISASYKGKFSDNHFEGTFTQNSQNFPLNLYRIEEEKKVLLQDKLIEVDLREKLINTQKLDHFLDYLVLNKQGVGSITVYQNGKEIYVRNFGQDQLPNLRWNSKTGYQIGSISKLFTATMLMQLVENGKLNLSDKLFKYYPEIPNAENITIETMLNHTSGLGDYVGEEYQWLFGKPVGNKVIIDKIKAEGVEFQPGEKIRYSNSGYYLLSRILEKISKKPYHQLLEKNITEKIGIKNTYSVLNNSKNVFKSFELENGKWVQIKDFDFTNCIGLGDIVSTTEDMSLFINALFNEKFITKETLEKMLPKPNKPFGLGVMRFPFYNKTSFGHGGDTAGTHSILAYNPEEKYSIAMSINAEEFPHNELAKVILNLIYDENYEYPKFEN